MSKQATPAGTPPASEPPKAAAALTPEPAPKRTFTSPTGEPVTVAPAPMPAPSPPPSPPAENDKKPEKEKAEAETKEEEKAEAEAKKREKTEAEAKAKGKAEEEDKEKEKSKVDSSAEHSEKEKASAGPPEEHFEKEKAKGEASAKQTMEHKGPAEEKKADPASVVVVAKTATSAEPTEPAVVPIKPSTQAEEPKKVVLIPAATMPIGRSTEQVAIVEKPAMAIEKRSSMPIMPSTQVVEDKAVKPASTPVVPVLVPVAVPEKKVAEVVVLPSAAPVDQPRVTSAAVPSTVPVAQSTQYIGTLEPIKRRIAIFSSSVALSSTTLHFGDKLHQDLLDPNGRVLFRFDKRHNLSDENGVVLACLHKSLCRNRWHAESMKHQTRLLTIRRRQHGLSLRLTIQNCLTDKSEELIFLKGRVYDGLDPANDKIAVMYGGDGIIQVAKGSDLGIAAVLAFVVDAWDVRGSTGCCL